MRKLQPITTKEEGAGWRTLIPTPYRSMLDVNNKVSEMTAVSLAANYIDPCHHHCNTPRKCEITSIGTPTVVSRDDCGSVQGDQDFTYPGELYPSYHATEECKTPTMVDQASVGAQICSHYAPIKTQGPQVWVPQTVTRAACVMAAACSPPTVEVYALHEELTDIMPHDLPDSPPPQPLTLEEERERIEGLNYGKQLTEAERDLIMTTVFANRDTLAFSRAELGRTHLIQHSIKLQPGAKPVTKRPYRHSYAEQEVERKLIREWEKQGLIQRSTSSWALPLILVRKGKKGKDPAVATRGSRQADLNPESWRGVVDFRALNAQCEVDSTLPPLADDVLQALSRNGRARVWSTLDIQNAYWQVDLTPRSREMTTMCTRGAGNWCWTVMPQGLSGGPACFNRLMDIVLGPVRHCCCHFFDDVVVTSEDVESHARDLELVLEQFRRAGLKISPAKCLFGSDNISFLGHQISPAGVLPLDSHLDRIKGLQPPRTLRGLRAILGLCGYYKRFIARYSELVRPLNDLLKKDTPFVWGPAQQQSFEELKNRLCNPPILVPADPAKPYILAVDASYYALGCILSQLDENGKDRPIAYYSRVLTPAEARYAATELELLGCVYALKTCAHYLRGAKFTLVTDHSALRYLLQQTREFPSARLARWCLFFQEWIPYMNVVHKPGLKHSNVDGLSRLEVSPNGGTDNSQQDHQHAELQPRKRPHPNNTRPTQNQAGCGSYKDREGDNDIEMVEYKACLPSPLTQHEYGWDEWVDNELAMMYYFDRQGEALSTLPWGDLQWDNEFVDLPAEFLEEGWRRVQDESYESQATMYDSIDFHQLVTSRPSQWPTSPQHEVFYIESGSDDSFSVPSSLACERCGWTGAEGLLVLCSACHKGTHTFCMQPKLAKVPGGRYFCDTCREHGPLSHPQHNESDLAIPAQEQDTDLNEHESPPQSGLDNADNREEQEPAGAGSGDSEGETARLATVDITQDEPVIRFLSAGEFPETATHAERNRIRRRARLYEVINGTLHKKFGPAAESKPIPPVDRRLAIVREYHDRLGHLGQKKTIDLVSHHYWWRGLGRDVRNFVAACEQCQRSERTFVKQTELKPITVNALGERISVDILSLPKSYPLGNKHVLTCVEHASGHIFAFPIPDGTGPVVASKLALLFSWIGMPNILQTDQGGPFISAAVQTLLRRYGIKHRISSAYHPNANGKCEKANSSIISSLRRQCSGKDPSMWEMFLAETVLALNNSKSDSTKIEPSRVLMGRLARLPAYAELTQKEAEALASDGDDSEPLEAPLQPTESELEQQQARQQAVVERALNNLKEAQGRQKKYYDKRHAPAQARHPLQVGGMVLCAAKPRQGKLEDKSDGPFMLVGYTTPEERVCILRDRTGQEWQVNRDSVRPFKHPTALRQDPGPSKVNKGDPRSQAPAAPRRPDSSPGLSSQRTLSAKHELQVNEPLPSEIDLVSSEEQQELGSPESQNTAAAPPPRRSTRPRKPRRDSPEPSDDWDKLAARLQSKTKRRPTDSNKHVKKTSTQLKRKPAKSRSPPPSASRPRVPERTPGKP